MAKSKRKKQNLKPSQKVSKSPQPVASTSQGSVHALRETLESIVIAFVLAFLFRTFEAEAFVIPTGSMSPSLQGQHKDVICTESGYRFRTSASSEGDYRQDLIKTGRDPSEADVIAGISPICRQPILFRDDGLNRSYGKSSKRPAQFASGAIDPEPTYPGDRILVNKYCYALSDPKRWDVVVFKYPGNGEMNYIKRLIGLPNETLRVFQGDVFARKSGADGDFQILRKPPEKVLAMLQDVHDTNFDPLTLHRAGWPLRWSVESGEGWNIETAPVEKVLRQRYVFKNSGAETNWIRYRHFVPSENAWSVARQFQASSKEDSESAKKPFDAVTPELISDFNPYNASMMRRQVSAGSNNWNFSPHYYGTAWVSDLAVECEVEVEEAQGNLVLDLVEAGNHFSCQIDLKTGKAGLGIEGLQEYQPQADTPLKARGKYKLMFANVDDQLLLWIDGELIDFGDTTFDFARIVKDRHHLMPKTSEEDPGDLAPVGVGAQNTSLVVNRLKVLRDIYYIAANWKDPKSRSESKGMGYTVDYPLPEEFVVSFDGEPIDPLPGLKALFRDPKTWSRFANRHARDFPLEEDQFFVMGDNSPESLDCRLWFTVGRAGGKPGGPYLDRRLLIGKAVCVFWPHGWGSIPGLPMLPGFPNFGDMRLVR